MGRRIPLADFIGIDDQDPVVRRIRDSGLEGRAVSKVATVTKHTGAGRRGPPRRVVARPIVHYEDFIIPTGGVEVLTDTLDLGSNVLGFVLQ